MPTRSEHRHKPARTGAGRSPRVRARRQPAPHEAGEAERTCVVTREVAAPEHLLRICVGPDGLAWPDWRARAGGRGAWLRPRRDVLELAEAKPAILRRALDAPELGTAGLLERARATNFKVVLDLLSLCSRAGALAGGAEQVEEALRGGEALGMVLAEDASEQSVARARACAPQLPAWQVPLTKEELGRRIGKGPRAVLALRPASPSRSLVAELRRMADLR